MLVAIMYLLTAASVYGLLIATARFEPEYITEARRARILEWLSAEQSDQQQRAA
jgi:hypothetical protein